MTVFDMSLNNKELYADCKIEEIGGRLTLVTSVTEAVNIVGRNAKKMVDAIPSTERAEITLTGAMAVWAYMVVVHQVMHSFKQVFYNDGKSPSVLIAQH